MEETNLPADLPNLSEEEVLSIKFLLFNLEKDTFGIPIEQISQIQVFRKYYPVPGSPDYVLGVTNFRGKVITLINLKSRLGIGAEMTKLNDAHIMYTDINGETIGIFVDSSPTIQSIPLDCLKDELTMISTNVKIEFLNVTAIIEHKSIALINLNRVFSDYETKENISNHDQLLQSLKKKEKIILSEEKLAKLDLDHDEFLLYSDDKENENKK